MCDRGNNYKYRERVSVCGREYKRIFRASERARARETEREMEDRRRLKENLLQRAFFFLIFLFLRAFYFVFIHYSPQSPLPPNRDIFLYGPKTKFSTMTNRGKTKKVQNVFQ